MVAARVDVPVRVRRLPRLAAAFLVLRLLLSDRAPADRVPHGVHLADGRPGGAAVQLHLSAGVGETTLYD